MQEKDRAKFGPEYGDRFCMLQLVGRHEMDKVQLQHESEAVQKNGTNGMNGVSAGLNGLNAAALALQALAAANPALLLSQNPWLAQHMQQQLLNGMPQGTPTGAPLQNPFGANMHAQQQGSMPVIEAAHLAQQLAAGQHLGGAGEKWAWGLRQTVGYGSALWSRGD